MAVTGSELVPAGGGFYGPLDITRVVGQGRVVNWWRSPPAGGAVSHDLATRLNHLFETVHPRGRGQYSNPEVADAITESGVRISAAYLWLLRTGRRDNPTLRHIEALARFFGVPPGYFFDDDQAAAVDRQLELLVAARDADVREIMLRSTDLSKPNRDAVLQIIKNIKRTQGGVDGSDQSTGAVGGTGVGGWGPSTESKDAGPERPDQSSG